MHLRPVYSLGASAASYSAHLDPALIRGARSSLWWDCSPAFRHPQDIRAGARRARDAGVTGCIPSLETFTPYDESPFRVNRIAYRG